MDSKCCINHLELSKEVEDAILVVDENTYKKLLLNS